MDLLYFTAFSFLCSYQGIFASNVSEINNVTQLNMEKNSAAYIFSQSNRSDNIAIENLKRDRQNETFDSVWDNAVDKMKCKIPRGLRKEHMVAVYAYTANFPTNKSFHKIFNEEVRQYGANLEIYANKFRFKSFHYLLTIALQKIKQDSNSSAEITYRGIQKLAQGTEGSEIRLGSFASSSLDKNVALKFINRKTQYNTLFKISTLYGANIENCSSFPKQKEVLIPPYEVFQVGQDSPWKYGGNISLKGKRKEGLLVKLETGKDGELVVVLDGGIEILPLGGLWILAVLASDFM